MGVIKRAMILLLVFCMCVMQGAERSTWLKRLGAAVVCAAGAFDATTTFSAYSRDPGGHENNALLANAQGKPSPWKFGLIKGAMCGGAIWAAESKRVPAVLAVPLSGALAIPQVVAGAKNMAVPAAKK